MLSHPTTAKIHIEWPQPHLVYGNFSLPHEKEFVSDIYSLGLIHSFRFDLAWPASFVKVNNYTLPSFEPLYLGLLDLQKASHGMVRVNGNIG